MPAILPLGGGRKFSESYLPKIIANNFFFLKDDVTVYTTNSYYGPDKKNNLKNWKKKIEVINNVKFIAFIL